MFRFLTKRFVSYAAPLVKNIQRKFLTDEECSEAQVKFHRDLTDLGRNVYEEFLGPDRSYQGQREWALEKAQEKFLEHGKKSSIGFHKTVFVKNMEKKYNTFASYEGRIFSPIELEKEMRAKSAKIQGKANTLFSEKDVEALSPFKPGKYY